MNEYTQQIAKILNTTPEFIGLNCENIIVNNDVFKDVRLDEELPKDYPYGWCDIDTWEAFVDRHPGEYWLRWDEMLYENIDMYLDEDTVQLKER